MELSIYRLQNNPGICFEEELKILNIVLWVNYYHFNLLDCFSLLVRFFHFSDEIFFFVIWGRPRRPRDIFKKIRDTKGTFHAKMGSIKDRNDRDLTEAEDIKKRWKEYTELYKKDLNDLDHHDGMITPLELVILEYDVKWASGSITTNKAREGD